MLGYTCTCTEQSMNHYNSKQETTQKDDRNSDVIRKGLAGGGTTKNNM